MKKLLKILIGITLAFTFYSCIPIKKEQIVQRVYEVRLSNWEDRGYYECDEVIWVDETHLKLKNKEDIEPFMEVIIPRDVVVRISKNQLNK